MLIVGAGTAKGREVPMSDLGSESTGTGWGTVVPQ